MKEIILYASDKCPDCPPVIDRLDEKNITCRLVNITNSMAELKEFLKLRDNLDHFDTIKEAGLVGIPSLMVDGNMVDVDDFFENI